MSIQTNPEDTLRDDYTYGYNDGVYDTLLKQLTAAEEYFKDGYSLGFKQGKDETVKNLMSALNYIVDTNQLDASKGKLEREIKKFIYTYCENVRG